MLPYGCSNSRHIRHQQFISTETSVASSSPRTHPPRLEMLRHIIFRHLPAEIYYFIFQHPAHLITRLRQLLSFFLRNCCSRNVSFSCLLFLTAETIRKLGDWLGLQVAIIIWCNLHFIYIAIHLYSILINVCSNSSLLMVYLLIEAVYRSDSVWPSDIVEGTGNSGILVLNGVQSRTQPTQKAKK